MEKRKLKELSLTEEQDTGNGGIGEPVKAKDEDWQKSRLAALKVNDFLGIWGAMLCYWDGY